MKINIAILAILLLSLVQPLSRAQDIDTELANFTERLATRIKDKNIKKTAVIDFTDLHDNTSELGRYIAEQITVSLVMSNRTFAVLDRANLNRILAEHKLTAKGLIDPDNCKKLGMFAGVDAIIVGKIIPKGETINITAKVIATETSEIQAADKTSFKVDDTVKELEQSRPQAVLGASGANSSASSGSSAPKIVKSFGDLRVELQSLQVIDNGRSYLLTAVFSNTGKKSIWVLASGKSKILAPAGNSCQLDTGHSAGISIMGWVVGNRISGTELKPGESTTATISFSGQRIAPGQCTLQIDIILGTNFKGGEGNYDTDCVHKNLVEKMQAE